MQIMSTETLVIVIMFILGSTTMSTAEPPSKGIFILAGQSNMAGRGWVYYNASAPPENYPDPLKVFRLTANLTWEVARDPLHMDIDVLNNKTKPGVGPGMSFANILKECVEPVGLVPCAIGGSKINQWARGKTYYEDMVHRTKSAKLLGGELKAFLWYQGEGDTGDDEVNTYRDNLENLIQNVRDDLSSPDLPVIVVAIASAGPTANAVNVEKLREIQKSIQLPNVSSVDVLGLELQHDQLHLTTKAQVQLGLMLAKEYLDKFNT